MCSHACAHVRGQLVGTSSLFLPCGFQGSKSLAIRIGGKGHLACFCLLLLFVHLKTSLPLGKCKIRDDWSGGPVIDSVYCSCRGLEFSSQPVSGSSQPPVTQVPGDPALFCWPLWVLTHLALVHTCAHMHTNKYFLKIWAIRSKARTSVCGDFLCLVLGRAPPTLGRAPPTLCSPIEFHLLISTLSITSSHLGP